MITKLTQEQEAKIPQYREEFLRLGLATGPCDRAKAEESIKRAYEYMKLSRPTFEWFSNPLLAARRAAELSGNNNQAYKASYGSFEAYWASFYCFIGEQLPVEHDNLISIVRDIVTHCGACWTFEGLVIMSERPTSIHFNEIKQLHRDDGPALEYDGFGVYALNGVRMPKEFVMTPASEIKVVDIMKQSNVEIRRELFRKVGFERVFNELGAKVLDTKEDYSLVELDFGDEISARYLKMLNPSIGTVHVEGVDDACKTVNDALAFRNREILEAIGAKGWQPPMQLT